MKTRPMTDNPNDPNDKIEILIAEDSPTQAAQLTYLLEQNNYKVTAATNGREALALLAQHKPALVISDVVMPELDGYGLSRAIKSDEALKEIPVMLVTTLSDPIDVIRGLDCGADNFLRKPYEERYLLARIDYLLMNTELRKNQKMQLVMEIDLGGSKHFINSDRQQILDLLISTYEQSIEINRELRQREKELADSNALLHALSRITEGLNRAGSEHEVAELALNRALELPGVQAGWIQVLEDDSRFRLLASVNLPPALCAGDAFDGPCFCQRSLLDGKLEHAVNVFECERLGCAKEDTWGLRYHASISLCLGNGHSLGLMNLVGPEQGLFDAPALKMLLNVGNQVAVALERARMHENLELLVAERTAKLAAEIEERKRIERQHLRLVSIIEATPDYVGSANLAGEVIFINRGGLDMLGYDASQDMPALSVTGTHPEWAARKVLEVGIPHALEHGSWSGETALLRRDGTLIPVSQVIIAQEEVDGEVKILSTIMRDISEHKRDKEALLQLNETLEQKVVARTVEVETARRAADDANHAKSAFLATMSHEIRTPMNGVLGMLEVLEHSNLTEHQRDQVQTMNDSAVTLLALIDDILDFSKIEAGRIELEHVPLCVADLVEGLCSAQLSVAQRHGVALRMFVDPELPERVLGDDTRLRQVLYNLWGNAIKFSAGNPARPGRVAVRATLLSYEPLRIAFRIEDNGVGMDEAALARLFTPFTQAEASTTRRFGGTGLGLTICRRLVNLMGGEIDVSSHPGEGSLFTVTLPFVCAPEQPIREQPDLSDLVCFLLDDAEIDAAAQSRYLEHAGATVQRCSNIEEAIRFAAAAASPVVLIHADVDSRPWQNSETPMNLRRVRIGHGRRRRARLDAPDSVSLDGDALRRQAFLRAVAVAAGRASPEVFDDRSIKVLPGESIPPPTVAQARAEKRLILVAEDDSVNQKVVLQQLALLGYAAEVASDGAEALARWEEGGFALLITDLHMPAMDGYQLAAEIRQREGGEHRMPILALTANALRGEATRAKMAGMDDYLTKPVPLVRLREVLDSWLPRGEAVPTREEASTPVPTRALDVAVLQRLVGDDLAVLHDFLSEYAHALAQATAELHTAARAKDHAQVAATAHKLKSSSRSVGALPLGDLCVELENAGKRNDGSAVARHMAQFETLLAELEEELSPLLSEEKKS